MNPFTRRSAALILATAGLAVPAVAHAGTAGEIRIVDDGSARLQTVLRWGAVANVTAPAGRVSGTLRYRGDVVARGRATSDGVSGTGIKLRFTKAARKRLRRVEGPVRMRLTVTSAAGGTARSTVRFR